MINSDLISYIKKQIDNNLSKDLIISKLIGVGWHREDIDEGFSTIEREQASEPKPKISTPSYSKDFFDKYREPVATDNIIDLDEMVSSPRAEEKNPEKPEPIIEKKE